MCDTCGCDGEGPAKITKPGEDHEHIHAHGDLKHIHHHHHNDDHEHEHPHAHDHKHDHDHDHGHDHAHEPHHTHEIKLETDVLQQNNMLAERNRGFFEAKHIYALNLVSSPGSGKTSLLERTLREMGTELDFFVIEGDQQTMNDANRIAALKTPVVQVNTGNGCHLDAEMVQRAVRKLEVADHACLIIENVGNLVCPSLFDLGENARVVVISVTEGEDKPLKYPNMFHSADLCIINKTDLLPYVDFNVQKAREYALQVNHHLEFIECSVKTGEGMTQWYEWLKKNVNR